MKKSHKTIALAIIIAIALGILAMFIPKAASATTADVATIPSIKITNDTCHCR
ncbi:hypothetical protein N9112_03675 [bacterium]|jgi:hypothetical protein|nr:hypothetical protein [bacterium]